MASLLKSEVASKTTGGSNPSPTANFERLTRADQVNPSGVDLTLICEISSAVEQCSYTAKVGGSIPSSRTNLSSLGITLNLPSVPL